MYGKKRSEESKKLQSDSLIEMYKNNPELIIEKSIHFKNLMNDKEYKRKSEINLEQPLGTVLSRPIPLKRTKAVLQFDMQGNFIKKYDKYKKYMKQEQK